MSEETLNREEAIVKIRDLIKDIHIAMLTTTDESGDLHARPMATQAANFSGDLWFLTREDSGKTHEIRHDSKVNLTYADEKHTFVSISGRAAMSRDRAKIEELWNPMHKAWFPEGKDDPSIAVLQVHAEEAEYWEASSSAIVRNYKILKAAVTGDSSDVGKHAKVAIDQRRAG